MTKRALLAPLVLVIAACSAEAIPSEHAARLTEPIINGTPSTSADDAIVYIAVGNEGEFCSGTLITPNLVITARHCTWNMNENSDCGTFTSQMRPSSLGISIGVQVGDSVAMGTKIYVDTAKGNSGCGNDIALFQLDHDIPNAKVAPVRFTPLTVGEAARTEGYGEDSSGEPTDGRYVKNGLAVNAVGPASFTYLTQSNGSIPVDLPAGEIVTGESTCFGDSGGPLFDAAGNIIGVTSRGVDDTCIDRPSIFSDTASHAQLIQDAATDAGHPLTTALPASTADAGVTTPDAGDPTTDPGDDGTSGLSGGDDSSSSTPAAATPATDDSTPAKSGCAVAGTPGHESGEIARALALLVGLLLVTRRRSPLSSSASRSSRSSRAPRLPASSSCAPGASQR